MSAQNHGSSDQRGGADCAECQQIFSLEPPQKGCPKKASDHRAGPVERNKPCRGLGGEACNLRQAEIIHQKASNRNLCAHICKNSHGTQDEVAVLPDRGGWMPSRVFLASPRRDWPTPEAR